MPISVFQDESGLRSGFGRMTPVCPNRSVKSGGRNPRLVCSQNFERLWFFTILRRGLS